MLVNFFIFEIFEQMTYGQFFWVILRVYTYDVIILKCHQNRLVNKANLQGQNPPPSPGKRALAQKIGIENHHYSFIHYVTA